MTVAKRRLGSYEAFVRTFVKTFVRKINDGKRPFSLHYEYSLYYEYSLHYECSSLKTKVRHFTECFLSLTFFHRYFKSQNTPQVPCREGKGGSLLDTHPVGQFIGRPQTFVELQLRFKLHFYTKKMQFET